MAKQLTVLERLENLERGNESLDKKLDATFNQIRSQMSNAMEVVEGTVGILSEATPDLPSKIDERMKANREKRKIALIEQEVKQMAQMVEMGVLKVVNAVSPTSLIVARTFDDSGEVMGIGREQFEYTRLHPSIAPEFLAKEVGFVYTATNGRKIEVLEIYDIVPQNEVKTVRADASGNPAPVETPSTES